MFRDVLRDPVLPLFDPLPRGERLFVRGRLLTAPLRELARRVRGTRVLELGCGHGLLTGMIAQADLGRTVLGIDPDPRKIDWARRSVGALPNVALQAVALEELGPEFHGTFDTLVVADVLYLLPPPRWPQVLSGCARLLAPGGQLLLKEAEADGSWKHWKCIAQELVMVHLLRRTQSSGGMTLLPRAEVGPLLRASGFEPEEVVPLPGYSTPHILYVAKRAP